MFHLLFIIISYGALLILLMPATSVGVLSAAVMFAIGVCLILYKKAHKVTFWKNKEYYLFSIAALLIVLCVPGFYSRWLASTKMQAIAAIFHIPITLILVVGSVVLSVLSVYFLYILLHIIRKKLSDTQPQNYFKKDILSCLIASAITVMLAQFMIGLAAFSMGYFNFLLCVAIVSVVILLLYCLLGRMISSILLGAGLFMIISTINVYVYSFRERLFEPVDIFSAGTAMNVAENYSLLPIPVRILIGWGIFAATLIVLYFFQKKSQTKLTTKKRYVLLAISVIGAIAIFFYSTSLKTYHWHKDGATRNGYFLDFVSKFKEISAPKPDNYNTDLIAELAEQYNSSAEEATEPPHIIVIMDEAFSDLRVIGDFSTNTEVMPFISSLKENTISGYTLTSVYGGNTANSEYEFLTGNSLAWMSPNAVPYQQYVRESTYSIVSHLKSSYNYKCVAMHPFESSGWNRPTAYEYLGFDESYFIEDFPQMNFVRKYVSDQEMFEFLIKTYEAQKENPLFLFGVSMQNHGGYTYAGENYTQHISLNNFGDEYPKVEQYLSLIHETDKAVEHLITYFQNVDDDVVIVFFGDHQPKIDESFYEAISGTTADTLDEQQKRYKIPFFIWANYDIEEKSVDCTSLNYLSSYVYDVAGIPLPPYNQFLQEMEKTIPSINANGFYSSSAERYLPFDKANEDELAWLESYEILQYNSIFDNRHRNDVLFPTSD